MFEANTRVISVKDFEEILQMFFTIIPEEVYVIQVSEPDVRFICHFGHYLLFPLCHEDVCTRRGKSFTHHCTFDLEVVLFIEVEVISGKTNFQKLE